MGEQYNQETRRIKKETNQPQNKAKKLQQQRFHMQLDKVYSEVSQQDKLNEWIFVCKAAATQSIY